MRFLPVFGVTFILGVTPAAAAPPDVATIVQQMQAALEPLRPSTQKLTISVRAQQGDSSQFVASLARKKAWGEDWTLAVVQAPEGLHGITYLVREQTGQPALQWVYLPVLRRVRELMPIGAYEDFLGTDFTYGDLGLVNLPDRKSQFLGMEKHAGIWAYKVQEIPQQPWYYSRIISWVAADSFLPLEREYYAPSKRLWKIERFGEIKRIDGVPTPLWIRMEDLQDGSSSTIAVSDVCYDTNVPDILFDPSHLSEVVASPVWQGPLRANSPSSDSPTSAISG
jgi:hypothetical protein